MAFKKACTKNTMAIFCALNIINLYYPYRLTLFVLDSNLYG